MLFATFSIPSFSIILGSNTKFSALISSTLKLKYLSNRIVASYASGCTAVLSKMLVPLVTRRKPAHCSKALSPNFGTFLSCSLVLNSPLSWRYFSMFLAMLEFNPATWLSRLGLAVLTSTPTLLTQVSTTPSSTCVNLACGISCWYCPTPMLLTSILISSASGSCNLLAIDTALRSATSKSGNSWAPSLLAE